MITGEQFVELSGKLAARANSSEAEQRSAISRAYYGAFHLAKSFLTSLPVKVEERNHDFVKNCFISSNHDALRHVGYDLGDLRAERNRADYEIGKALVRNNMDAVAFVRQCVESARQISSVLAACQSEALKREVKTAIDLFLSKRKHSGNSGLGEGSSAN